MNPKHLIAVEKWTCILAALLLAVALLALPRHAAFGVAVGAGLMVLNAYALRRIGARVFRTFKSPGKMVLFFNLKMFVLVGLVFLIIRYLHVNPVAFVVGISIFPVAIVIVALQHSLHPEAYELAASSDDGDEEKNG